MLLAADALMAFRRGEASQEAELGAVLVAEALAIFRKANTERK